MVEEGHPNYGFESKIGDPRYEQLDFSEVELRVVDKLTGEREGVVYGYDSGWGYIDRVVNPMRFGKNLERMTREDSDLICRMLKNFELDHLEFEKKRLEQGKSRIVEVEGYSDVLEQGDVMTVVLERNSVIQWSEIRAPMYSDVDFDKRLATPKVDKQGDTIPKWKRNLPPSVRNKLKRRKG